ncbi:hypothetical protein WN55_08134 [Dufourea novaeangliae]|uniref:Uncharacterized protein n=1 Tax=Dufourea novaeangliae TaxID=178035 RepID=A0A154P6Z8_DUFNO|nr:hypothetical protein WN55_08134 [Dufourea novaeangliae]
MMLVVIIWVIRRTCNEGGPVVLFKEFTENTIFGSFAEIIGSLVGNDFGVHNLGPQTNI